MSGAQKANDLHPLIQDRLHRPRTVLAPGARVRFNVVPILVNLLAPWGIFVFCCGICSFHMMFVMPGIVRSILAGIFVIWLASLALAAWARSNMTEPTWFTYACIMVGLAVAGGSACGDFNFQTMRRFYEIQELKVVHDIDASRKLGQDLMDAGIVKFAKETQLDLMRSWHFKHHRVYCVAPIIGNMSDPETQSYDFWAVGTDCCSLSSSDFRCGSWENIHAGGAIRVLDEEELPFYHLAVQQAETLYGMVSTHPIFFTWSADPVSEVRGWKTRTFKNFLFFCAAGFVASILLLTLATCKFAWIGRTQSVYGTDIYGVDNWKVNGRRSPDAGDYGSA